MRKFVKEKDLNTQSEIIMDIDYRHKINLILYELEKNNIVFSKLEKELKGKLLLNSTIRFDFDILLPFTVSIHFNGFKRSKKEKDKWFFQYTMYTLEDGVIDLPMEEVYDDFNKLLYDKILEIACIEKTFLKINRL